MLKSMPKRHPYPQHELGERLREALASAKVSQAELARACGVTDQAVHDWLLTGRIGKHHLVTICTITKKSFEYFLRGLGRAAVLALLAITLIAQPPNAYAGPSIKMDRGVYYVKWMLHRIRLWLLSLLRQFSDATITA